MNFLKEIYDNCPTLFEELDRDKDYEDLLFWCTQEENEMLFSHPEMTDEYCMLQEHEAELINAEKFLEFKKGCWFMLKLFRELMMVGDELTDKMKATYGKKEEGEKR